ncbi:NosD domain-containing protein [Candidatus Aenigmatarchaeota archaeon]
MTAPLSQGNINNLNVINCSDGIELYDITNTVIENIYSNTNGYGISFSGNNNSLLNLTLIDNNLFGLKINTGSTNNTIINSTIRNSTQYGISLFSGNNLFYNNIFNNTVNVYSDNDTYQNSWNTTLNCSAGPNIIDGPCIGGNLWTDPDGNYSDNCTDVIGPYGICDSSYTSQINNTDYLPLTQPTAISCHNCSDCSSKVQASSSGDIIYLNASITNQSGTCIDFNGTDNITFDCDGHYIDGDDVTTIYGIYLSNANNGSNNSTVRNCNISDFPVGINLNNCTNNNITDSIIRAGSSTFMGISTANSATNNTFTNITLINTSLHFQSGNNMARNVTIIDSTQNILGITINANELYVSAFVNDVDESNTINSKPIRYLDGTYRPCPNNQVLEYNDTYSQVLLVGCNNITLSNTTVHSLIVANTNNSEFYDIHSNYSYYFFVHAHSNNNTIRDIVARDTPASTFIISYSSNNTFSNMTSILSGSGFLISGSSNNTLSNLTVNESYSDGFWIQSSSDNNVFSDIVINDCGYDGFYAQNSDNIVIDGITIDKTVDEGFQLGNVNNISVTNMIITEAGDEALYVVNMSDSFFENITSLNNTDFGWALYDSSNNTFINMTISENNRALYMLGSHNNTFRKCVMMNNTAAGLYFTYHSSYTNSSDNLFYDNVFNNTVNVMITHSNFSLTNVFNTTLNCSAEPNIIGGNCIGGNYWTGPNGNYSDICIDANGDGICDSSYTPVTNVTDYLPLTDVSPGIPCHNCSDCSTKIQAASSGDMIYLNTTITGQSGTCIEFNGTDNVTFDCNWLTISGTGSGYGIDISNTGDGSNNNTIRNCPGIDSFNAGVDIFISDNTKLENIRTFNNTLYGFNLYMSNHNNFTNITAFNNVHGLEAFQITNTTLNGLNVYNNSDYGIRFMFDSDNNSFNNVNASYNGEYGIWFSGLTAGTKSDYNNFTNMYIHDNGLYGIWTEYYTYIMYENVTITKQGNVGGLSPSGGSTSGSFINVTINGKPVLNFHDIHNPCPNNQTLEYNDTYSQIAMSYCYNITIKNSIFTDGLYFFYTDNSTVYNVNSSHSANGFYIVGDYNNITNNIILDISDIGARINGHHNNFTYNTLSSDNVGLKVQEYQNIISHNNINGLEYGIYIHSNHNNNTYSNNLISNSNNTGIHFDGTTENQIIENNTFYNNTIGIKFNKYNQKNHRIINNTIYESSDKAIALDDLSNLTIESNTIYNNGYGIHIVNSTNGTIYNNTISNNNYYGIYFNNTWNLTVYNNYLDNTVNLGSNNNTYQNYLNTTLNCSAGPNIVGGDCVGGNYWTDSNGNYSDTCADSDRNGICDSSYTPVTNSTDYHPLTSGCVESWSCTDWSVCLHSLQTRTCTDLNGCGTELNKPTESQYCTTGGGGGGGAGGGEPVSFKKTWDKITPGVTINMSIEKEGLDLMEIKLSVKNQANWVSITVTKVAGKPAWIQHEVSGKVYQYVQIAKNNLDDDNIESPQINFRVSKEWINANSINKNTIFLYRYDQAWDRLTTKILDEDLENIYYRAYTPGFSYFAISGEQIAVSCSPGERRCDEIELQECNTEGNDWILIEECGIGCDSEAMSCVSAVDQMCAPGEKRCNGNELEECSSDGTGWEVIEICRWGCYDGECNEFTIIDYENFLGYVFIILIVMVLILIGGILISRKGGHKKRKIVGLHEPKEEPRPMGYMDKIPVKSPERPPEGPVTLIGGRRVQRYRDKIRLLIRFRRKKKYKKPDTKPYWRD